MAEVLDVVLALVSNPYLRQQGQQEVLGPESQELIEYDYQRQDFYGDDFRFNLWWWVWGESLEQELETDEISTALHYVWWAKRVKTDPFLNVSSNCVPPFEQGVEYHIGKFSNADISDFSVSRRVYRVEPPISSVFDKLGEG